MCPSGDWRRPAFFRLRIGGRAPEDDLPCLRTAGKEQVEEREVGKEGAVKLGVYGRKEPKRFQCHPGFPECRSIEEFSGRPLGVKKSGPQAPAYLDREGRLLRFHAQMRLEHNPGGKAEGLQSVSYDPQVEVEEALAR